QPAARAVPARRRPGARGGRRHGGGHRQGHGARMRASDGTAEAARLRRPRHDLRHRGDHVRRVPGEALRAAAAPEADGARGTLRQEVRAGLVRVRRRKVSDLLRVETEDRIRILTVHRPDKLNALNSEVMAALDAALDAARTDEGAGVVVVTGAGEKSFIAGADIGELSKLSPLEGREHARRGPAIRGKARGPGKPRIRPRT